VVRMDSSRNSPDIRLIPRVDGGFIISVSVPPGGLSQPVSDATLSLFRNLLSTIRTRGV
jgi:hypothetical protein